MVPLGRVASVQLGKMLQPAPEGPHDQRAGYLRAGMLGKFEELAGLDGLPEMWASPADAHRYSVERGDLVVAEGGDCGQAAFVPEVPDGTVIQNSLMRVRASSADIRFVSYVLASIHATEWLNFYCNRSTFGHLTREKLTALQLPVPPLLTQRAIADYLDRETARIDALIAAKKRMIILLDEQRHAWLSQTIQDIPASQLRLKYVAHIQGGVTLGKRYDDAYVQSWPYLRVANVQAGVVDLTDVTTTELPPQVAMRHRLKVGDLLLAEGNGNPDHLGRAVVWDGAIDVCLHQNHVFALRPGSYLRPKYLEAVLAADIARRHLREGASQVGIASISQEKVLSLRVPVPSLGRQDECIQTITQYDQRVATIRMHLSRQIDLLQEHRQALITAAVTGQLDIPEAA